MKHAVGAALLLLVGPGIASAQSLRLVDTMVFEYRGDNENGAVDDDNYGLGLNKLYLNGQMDRTSVSAQVDTHVFSNYPDALTATADKPIAYASEARLERLSIVHTLGDGTFTVGDGHMQIGRGLALSLRKVDELGTDQALRGGSVSWQANDFGATAFAGRTNVANLDGVTQKYIEDPNDILAGSSATLHLGRADVSVHGLYLRPNTPLNPDYDDDQTILGGAYVDFPVTDWLAIYAEGAVEEYRAGGLATQGTAAYGATDLDLQVVQLLLEGLWLDKFQVIGSQNLTLNTRHVYNQVPTLERIDQEVLNNTDVRAGRAKISRPFLDGDLVLYVSGMARQYGTSFDHNALHGYGGFELSYGQGMSRWYASGGYRDERDQGAATAFKTMVHAETDWVHALGGGYALHLTVNHEERTQEQKAYQRGTTLVGFDRFGLGSLMAEIGYDTQQPDQRQFFLAGIIAWEYDRSLTMRAVLGSQRGGIKCIGGVCRDFPAFAGARVEATFQHDLL